MVQERERNGGQIHPPHLRNKLPGTAQATGAGQTEETPATPSIPWPTTPSRQSSLPLCVVASGPAVVRHPRPLSSATTPPPPAKAFRSTPRVPRNPSPASVGHLVIPSIRDRSQPNDLLSSFDVGVPPSFGFIGISINLGFSELVISLAWHRNIREVHSLLMTSS